MKAGLNLDGSTIFAVASPPGNGLRGIVRLSGPGAWECVASLLPAKLPPPPRYLHELELQVPRVSAPVPATLTWMPGPHSYTREDVIELHTFGSPVLLNAICDALLEQGARVAGPGEFTRRAFMNGRIDLTQAEAVLAVIHARDAAEHRQAAGLLQGKLRHRIDDRRQRILRLCAFCEAAIDFSDQDIEVIDPEWVVKEIKDSLNNLRALLSASRQKALLPEGVRVVLVGRPNVGKSSLMNCLAGQKRVIVSQVPGTTRDLVEVPISHRGYSFLLRDAAGVHSPTDPLEARGIERAVRALANADIALLVLDASQALTEDDVSLMEKVDPRRAVLVLNKIDLPAGLCSAQLNRKFQVQALVRTSAITGKGREELLDSLVECSRAERASVSATIINARQRGCLIAAVKSLEEAEQTARAGTGLEYLALDLREALDHFSELFGETFTDDLLEVIFSEFCIGK